jgi:hypothetical protein
MLPLLGELRLRDGETLARPVVRRRREITKMLRCDREVAVHQPAARDLVAGIETVPKAIVAM